MFTLVYGGVGQLQLTLTQQPGHVQKHAHGDAVIVDDASELC